MEKVPTERRTLLRRPIIPSHIDRLRWLGVIVPVAFILALEAFRYFIVEGATASPGTSCSPR